MKTITSKIPKKARYRLCYVDGKRVSAAKATEVAGDNIRELVNKLLASSKYGKQATPNTILNRIPSPYDTGLFELQVWVHPKYALFQNDYYQSDEAVKCEYFFKTARGAIKALNWLMLVLGKDFTGGHVTRRAVYRECPLRAVADSKILDSYSIVRRFGGMQFGRRGLLD